MRIEIIENGEVDNTIIASEAFSEQQFPGAWRVAAVQPEPALPSIPQSITRAQGKAALIQAGMWAGVVAYVAAIEDDTERALAEVALNDTLEWNRSSPFLNAAAQSLGLTDEQLDGLFAAAAQISL